MRDSTSATAGDTPGRCRCAELTPSGRGALATIAVWGRGALAAVSPWFRPARGGHLTDVAWGRIVFGRWQTEEGVGEELVVCCRDAESIEVHCHGGLAAPHRIIRSLVSGGCMQVDREAWIQARHADPIRRDAYAALTVAPTQRTAAILLDQYRGALSDAIRQIRQDVLAGRMNAAADRLTILRHRSRFGLHLTTPWHVVLAGKPNSGKSSLVNAILGYQRSIVHDQPGTTRDVLTAATVVDGWPVQLVDTAGIHDTTRDPLEVAGIARTEEQVVSADLVIWVADMTASWAGQAPSHAAADDHDRTLIVHNKSDLATSVPGSRPPGPCTSALTGAAIPDLLAAIGKRLVSAVPPPGSAVPFLPRHVQVLTQVAAMLSDEDPGQSLEILRSLLPEDR